MRQTYIILLLIGKKLFEYNISKNLYNFRNINEFLEEHEIEVDRKRLNPDIEIQRISFITPEDISCSGVKYYDDYNVIVRTQEDDIEAIVYDLIENDDAYYIDGAPENSKAIRIGNIVEKDSPRYSKQIKKILMSIEKEGFPVQKLVAFTPELDYFEYIKGSVPQMGENGIGQFHEVLRMMKEFYKTFGKGSSTLCHGNLAPGNVVFNGLKPIGILNWNNFYYGKETEELCQMLCLWLDIGNNANADRLTLQNIDTALRVYGCKVNMFRSLPDEMLESLDFLNQALEQESNNPMANWIESAMQWIHKNRYELEATWMRVNNSNKW
ncbi:MAG: hypothetical protein ACRC42_00765 [Mycoplasma sp.]